MATETAAALDPTHGCADKGGPTGPLVHWLREAPLAAAAGWAFRSAGVAIPAIMATMVNPWINRRMLLDFEKARDNVNPPQPSAEAVPSPLGPSQYQASRLLT